MRWVKLGDVFEINRGGSPRPISKYVTKSPDGVNWIKISDTDNTRYISKTKEKIIHDGVSKSRRVEPGDFLLTNSMSFGRPYISQIEGCIHDGWLVLKPVAQNVMEDYLYHYLSSEAAMREFIKKAKGTTVKNLNISLVKDVKIPLPSLSEQRAIVERLDRAQRLIDIDREMLQRYDDLIQSVFLDMFGDIFKNPSQTPFNNSLKIKHGYAFKSTMFKDEGEVPVIKIGTVNKTVADFTKSQFVDIDCVKDFENYKVFPGDLLLSMTGTVGKDDYANPCVLPDNYDLYLLNQRVVKLIYDDKLYSRAFLYQYFKQPEVKNELTKYSRGIRQANLSNKDIFALRFNKPSYSKQKMFQLCVDTIESEKQVLQNQFRKSQKLFSSLVRQAFSKN